MGPTQTSPGANAYGQADLSLYLATESDDVQLVVTATWYTSDGQCRESQLSLQGDTSDGWDLMSEATTWLWKRWKRPIQQHGPFDERPV